MCSLIRKSAVLLLILLPLGSGKAELKRVPLILMDRGSFAFPDETNPNFAELTGDGVSTHLGKIESIGEFEKKDRRSGGFKGKIEGTARTVAVPAMATATSGETATAASSETANQGSITYRLLAEFSPGAAPNLFYGVGTYVITGGTGDFDGARGFGVFIGLANLDLSEPTYNCFLRGTIFY